MSEFKLCCANNFKSKKFELLLAQRLINLVSDLVECYVVCNTCIADLTSPERVSQVYIFASRHTHLYAHTSAYMSYIAG